jgi:hypothetical protein
VDVVVGRDAASRWEDIERRQQIRNKVRKESKEKGLIATGRNVFQPLSQDQKKQRTAIKQEIEKRGFNPSYEGKDEKLVR